MSLIVPNISITGFRAFRKLDIGPFGRVNLITGKNNSGKSSLLEAIRILVTEGSATAFYNILNYREELDQRSERALLYFEPEDVVAFCSLFSGFPTLAKCTYPFTIRTHGESNGREKSITVTMVWDTQPDLFGDTSAIPALKIVLPNREHILRSDRPRSFRMFSMESGEGVEKSCVFLNPFSSRTTSPLGALWDKIALTDSEKEVVRAMQIISPDIQAISMVGSEGGSRSRTAIVRSSLYDHPVPLRSFGDGVNQLFGLVLSLICARGGVLLVDEIEAGLHYSILPDVWRAVLRVAADLDIQVFATTHNWDCIDAFQKAVSEHPEDGVLARLTAKDDQIIPTLFSADDLRIVTRDRIEVR